MIEFYPKWVVMTAIPLYILHRFYPYDFREKFPYEDPPPKFLGSFSLGELVQFIIQVLSFPAILLIAADPRLSENAGDIIAVILLIIWGILPRILARKIDGW